jgi:outer membrane protein OmpA-like peptidoglycan-associated protein
LGITDFYKYTNVLYGQTQSWVSAKKPFSFQSFNFNAFSRSFGFTASYLNGPYNFYQQYAYFYGGVTSRVLRFTPYYNQYFFQKQLYLTLQLNYSNNIDKRLKYSNFTGQIYYYFPRDWSAYVLGVYSAQSSQIADEPESKYSNIYFEAGVKKAFGFQQPRLKYHDLKVVFFKDFNGNRVKDAGEPGVDNVVLSIQREDSTLTTNVNFSGAELISNQFGEVVLTKIPGGVYRVNFEAIGNSVGTFSKDLVDPYIVLTKDATVYYPFMEKNKVFGSLTLNRSKISALGNVDLSNIRITAQDSKGNIYSTLTNTQGKFTLFAPVKDNYIVSINNVLYENFDLRQNNYMVHFNGYKQFEVNFVFDEKIRTINFSKGGFGADLASGVLEIRRTNLRGSVKDANSLKPVVAKVNVINRANSQVIASITTNRTTGEYSVSFAAGKDYLLEIVSDSYWYYSQNLDLDQITTFEDVIKDVSLTSISVGSILELKNLTFDSKSSELTPEGVAEITRLVSMLKDNPTVRIQIQGHCDDLEALDNPAIGDARARNVARYLVERGFSKFETKNMGNTVPVAQNDTEENRRLNRRVDIVVTNK